MTNEILPPDERRAKEYSVSNWVPQKILRSDGSVVEGIPITIESGTVTIVQSNQAGIIYEDGSVLYVCVAEIASSLSDPVWQIKKVDMTNGVITKWCDGDDLFNNVATNLVIVKEHIYL